jgi:hypothetical protein
MDGKKGKSLIMPTTYNFICDKCGVKAVSIIPELPSAWGRLQLATHEYVGNIRVLGDEHLLGLQKYILCPYCFKQVRIWFVH